MKAKTAIIYIGGTLAILLVAVLVLFSVGWVSKKISEVIVINPAPHIECVKITTLEGVAIDCNWRE